MSKQSKRESLYEAITQTVTGTFISFLGNAFILWALGIDAPMHSQVIIVAWFTFLSFTRSYLLRRLFNYLNLSGRKR